MSDSFLTIKEAASFLKVHWQTIRLYIKRGDLKAIKVGRNVRIKESEIERFIEKKESESERYEVEIRFIIPDEQKLEKRLIQKGAKVVYHGHVIDHWFVPINIKNLKQKNRWFETGKGYGLRIREQDNGYTGKYTTTIEVKRLLHPYRHDTCLEQEIEIKSYDDGVSFLKLANFKEFIKLDKERIVYKLGEYKIIIDTIKGFKTGVEIEVVTSEKRDVILPNLKELAEKLKLDLKRQLVPKSVTYLAMKEFSKF